jgi:protein required for attachment to host cells
MNKTWVLVAESSRAKILEQEHPHGELHELAGFDHAASRLYDKDLVSSEPGRSFDSKGYGRHAITSEIDPKEHEVEVFAHQLAHHLEQHCEKKNFNKLVVIAPPEFLGILRHTFSEHLNKITAASVNKNLVHETAENIRGHLPYSF